MIDPKKYKFGADFNAKEEIKKARVTHDEKIKNAETLLSIIEPGFNPITLCTRGNISAIIGKAKSRKTFFLTMISAALINGSLFGKFSATKRIVPKIVFFDTEQGRYRAQKVLSRILLLSGSESYKYFDMISLRPYSSTERVDIIDEYFNTHRPDFAFIDGIRDLIKDFNNLTQSDELMTMLMRWSEAHECHISCVLHMNKADGNARGHLGSELMNKAETVVSLAKDGDFTTVESVFMRDGDFSKFQFTINEGLPVILGYENEIKYLTSEPVLNVETGTFDINRTIEPNAGFESDVPF